MEDGMERAEAEPKTERLHVLLSKAQVEQIDEWGWRNRVRTRADIVRRLLEIGLEASAERTEETKTAGQQA